MEMQVVNWGAGSSFPLDFICYVKHGPGAHIVKPNMTEREDHAHGTK